MCYTVRKIKVRGKMVEVRFHNLAIFGVSLLNLMPNLAEIVQQVDLLGTEFGVLNLVQGTSSLTLQFRHSSSDPGNAR